MGLLSQLKELFSSGPAVDYSTLVNKEDAIVLDVRSRGEFQQGHYENAMNIPLDQINDQKIKLLKKKNKPIITCCVSGARSGSAKRKLESAGISAVYNGGNWSSLARKIKG